jgi:hypothetical protein
MWYFATPLGELTGDLNLILMEFVQNSKPVGDHPSDRGLFSNTITVLVYLF